MSLNKVILIGNLGRDPEVRYMPNGEAVCNFSIATSETWNDRQTGQRQERTEWHNITLYRRLAEVAGQYLKTETYTAYILNDVKRWENLTRRCEQQTDTTDIASLMSLIHCYYGYTMMLAEEKQHDAVERNIARAERYIAIVLAKEPNNAEAIDYSGVFTSYAVSLNRLKAPTLGKRSRRLIDRALSIASNNPRILFDKGNSLFYPPAIFGGDKERALKYYRRAIEVIEQQGATSRNWIYLKLLLLEARCYQATGRHAEALKLYERLLDREPNFKIADLLVDE